MTPSLLPVTTKPLNAETPLVALAQPTTPNELFYVRNHFPTPGLEAATWQLSIGLLDGQTTYLSLQDLEALPSKTFTVTLACAGIRRKLMSPAAPGAQWGNGPISTASFTGTPLRHVLAQAGLDVDSPPDGNVNILFIGADEGKIETGETVPYARSLSLAQALAGDVIVAWAMNGEPLSRDHGFPARLIVPDWYGMASVKWLTQIHVSTQKFDGFFQVEHYVYWQDERFANATPISTMLVQSLIAQPGNDDALPAGQSVEISGTAWSGKGDVMRVQVKIDGPDEGPNGEGAWQEATIEPGVGYGASQWYFAWQPSTPGCYTLRARATDSAGNVQPLDHQWNRLGYGNNSVHAVVVNVTG